MLLQSSLKKRIMFSVLRKPLQISTMSSLFFASFCLLYCLPMTSSTSAQPTTPTTKDSSNGLSNERNAALSNDNPNSMLLQIHDNENRLFKHFKEPYSYRIRGQLTVNISDITTSSILIKWHLSNRTFNDSTIKSIVVCETFSGMIVSKSIVSSKASHRIEGLDSDSSYILCVDMLEKAPEVNTTVLHFTCLNAATIPVLRSDSIIGVILTLGYIFLMAAIGYFVWRKRTREIKEDRIPINADDDDEEEDEEEKDASDAFGRRAASPAGKVKYPITKKVSSSSSSKNAADKRHHVEDVRASNPMLETTGSAGNHHEDGGGGATNGCLDFGKNRSDASNASGKRFVCGTTNAEMEERRPSSKGGNKDGSPVKVTEIAF